MFKIFFAPHMHSLYSSELQKTINKNALKDCISILKRVYMRKIVFSH